METSHVKLLPGKPERPASAEMTGSRTVQRLVSLRLEIWEGCQPIESTMPASRGDQWFFQKGISIVCQIKSDEALSNCQNLQGCTIPQSNSLYTRGLSICRPCWQRVICITPLNVATKIRSVLLELPRLRYGWALAGRFGPCFAVFFWQETIPRIGNTLVPYRALVWQESKQV